MAFYIGHLPIIHGCLHCDRKLAYITQGALAVAVSAVADSGGGGGGGERLSGRRSGEVPGWQIVEIKRVKFAQN